MTKMKTRKVELATITDGQYRAAARKLHQRDGDIEIDDNAKTSRGDDPGAYVQAWVWVYNEDVTADTFGGE